MAGVRVLDFSWIIAGPTCSRLMGMMGAEIIKVESRRRPDPSRNGGGHLFLNQAKRSLTLNLSTARGLEIARALAAQSDVVIENFATGVIERMGLGYDELKRHRADLIMLSSAGLGHTGPDRDHVAYGTLLQCFTGWSGQTGRPGGKPAIGGVWSDPLTGMLQTFAILCALRHRDRTGEGMYIDVSMAEAMCTTLPEAFMDYVMNGRIVAPNGNRDRLYAPHDLYRCAGDDAWVAIAATNEAEWRELCARMGRPELANDPRFSTLAARRQNEDALDELIRQWTEGLTPEQVFGKLQPAVPSGPSYSALDLLSDHHLRQRGFFREFETEDGKAVRQPGVPWQISGSGRPRASAPPELGVDSRDILRELLGLPDSELEELERDEVLY
jgi:benzylsuccinate CoA-transferase BbsF subunit